MSSTRKNEDSGLVDLDAILKQSVAVVAAAPSPPPPAPASTPDDSLSAVAADANANKPAPTPSVEARPSVKPAAPRRGRAVAVVLGAVAAAALAAFAVTHVARAPRSPVVPLPVVVAKAPAVITTTTEPKPEPSPSGVDPSSLPTVMPEAPKVVAAPAAPRAAAPPKSEKSSEPSTAVAEKELVPAAPAEPSDLGNAMRSAVGTRAETKAEEATIGGDPNARQVRPSPGAVLGAMNAVLPAARACLGPDGAMRSGTLVFKSDGTVANVALKGAKTEDACVRGALAKARVQPFSDASFTTGFTVRP